MEQPSTPSTIPHSTGSLSAFLTDHRARYFLDAIPSLPAADEVVPRLQWKAEQWRRRTYEVLASGVGASRGCGPTPPQSWAPALHHLTELARAPVPPPSWWGPTTAFCGGLETRTDPTSHSLDGTNRPELQDPPAIYVHLTLAGWGHFEAHGEQPQKVTPGQAFLAINPSRYRYQCPRESPGWTFAWIGIHNPYMIARTAKQVVATGPLIDIAPHAALTASILRLVRGAIRKDFRDQFEAEIALFEFLLTFERRAQQASDNASEGQRLTDEVRSRIVARLPRAVGVHSLAAEFGMSRSHFSHFFRGRTGLTPAHFATEVRIQEAARMLLGTQAPLKTIAYACGFANANHFCKVFRRFRHLSPAWFRQACR